MNMKGWGNYEKELSGLIFGGAGLATVIATFLKGTSMKVNRDNNDISENENSGDVQK